MNISICITIKNEEESISKLLDSLLNQTKKGSEIVIVDGGSNDKTIEIINHYQKRHSNIKLLKENCSRPKGRNMGIEIAKNEVICMTDGGCIAWPDWVEKLTGPFSIPRVNVVAGFYNMVAKTPLQEAMRHFLGTTPDKFNINFLPSIRSMAFRKSTWEKVGGFPEDAITEDDTMFNYKLIKAGAKFSRVKDAIVDWEMPATIGEFASKIYGYARGDARSRVWLYPTKGIGSHNIKALLVLLRYLVGFTLVIYSFINPSLIFIPILLLLIYCYRSYRKAGLWGIPLQFVADYSVMRGFTNGILGR